MKLDLFLFIFALILAFLTGNMTYFIKSTDQVDLKDLKQIQTLHRELQQEITPFKRIDLNSNYPDPARLKLLEQPTNIGKKQKGIFLNSTECIRAKISQLNSSFVNKEMLWVAYLCNQVDSLPLNFFDSPPYIHSSGQSYSYMQYQILVSRLSKIRWLEMHAKDMHIRELYKLQWPLNQEQHFLMDLPSKTITLILSGENIFISKDLYFIKTGYLKYYIINKIIAQRFFKRARFTFSSNTEFCSFKIRNICWTKRPHSIQSIFSQSSIIIFIGTLIILFLTANSLYSRLRRKKKEEERKKHALRILTHELRTPITSLLLQINDLNQNPENLSDEVHEKLLKIEGQIYRLKHLAAKSQSYLQTNNGELISLNEVEIPSIKYFFEDIIGEYNSVNITLIIPEDFLFITDTYWLQMCIMNLIENAIRYGKTPIEIEIKKVKESISIIVRDYGNIPYINMKELLGAQHTNSKGLGLGLIIINKTLKEMGAKLTLSTSPTEFKISMSTNIKRKTK